MKAERPFLRRMQNLVVLTHPMEYATKYQSIVLMGKVAAGKGTQAEFILNHFGGTLYSNGNKVREVIQLHTPFGKRMKEVYESGNLIPEWIASYWMTHALVSQYEDDRVVFEAVAKKPIEAELFHEIHEWIDRPYIVFHIKVSNEEVHKRSALRARDIVDSPRSVEKRLEEYKLYTERSIEIFTQKGTLIEIDGSRDQEAVKEDIFKHLMA